MFKKEVLLGNFIKKYKILGYLEYIHNTYHIKYENLFVYTMEDNEEEYIVTFKIDTTKREIVNQIKGSTIFHYKYGCLFSINALNNLIEQLSPNLEDKKSYELNWAEYKDTIISFFNGEFSIKKITKIEDKGVFFK